MAYDPDERADLFMRGLFDITEASTYLSPAPLYHAAPLGFTAGTQRQGGTVVVMERFDEELALRYIEQYDITVSQWVPTMFVRMLKLDEEARHRHDLSSHRRAIHAAAPCPVEVKRRMIEWWGPILLEYYAGTEGNGTCFIDSETWLQKPGSVGKAANATLHICDDDGDEVAGRYRGCCLLRTGPRDPPLRVPQRRKEDGRLAESPERALDHPRRRRLRRRRRLPLSHRSQRRS